MAQGRASRSWLCGCSKKPWPRCPDDRGGGWGALSGPGAVLPDPRAGALPEERRSGCCGEMPGTHAAPGPGGRSVARHGALAGVTPEPRGSPGTSVLSAHSGLDPHVHSYSGARPLSSLHGLDSGSGGSRPAGGLGEAVLALWACGTMMAPILRARRAWSLGKEDDHAAQDTGTVRYVHIRRYKRNMLTSVQSRPCAVYTDPCLLTAVRPPPSPPQGWPTEAQRGRGPAGTGAGGTAAPAVWLRPLM